MRNFYWIILLIQVWPLILSGQQRDTIHFTDSTKMVIDKRDIERINNLLEEKKGVIMLGNYEIYDEDGKESKQSIFKQFGKQGHLRITYNNKQKSSEEFLSGDGKEYNLKLWSEKGNLIFEQITLPEYETQIYYSDNPFKNIEKFNNKKRQESRSYKGIQFEDTTDLSYWVEEELKGELLLPYGKAVEYHDNGTQKSIGEYSKRLFTVYRSKEIYERILEIGENYELRDFNNYRPVLNKREVVKHGKWKYYDRDGNLEKEEFYEDGRLIK